MFKYRCIQQFTAEGPGELGCQAGELVISKTNVATDGWLSVKSLQSQQEGFVPFAYLEFLANQAQAAPPAAQAPAPVAIGAASPNQYDFQQPAVMQGAPSDGLTQPSVDLGGQESPSNPFDTLGGLQSSLPPVSATTSATTDNAKSKRHSYVPGYDQKDQYQVSNPTQFQETLELWRERERRFMKGEPERLPQPKKREYFYWDRMGNRHGPFTEDEMRAKFDTRELAADTPISLNVENANALEAASLQSYFPEMASAFQTVPVVAKSAETLWLYKDDLGNVQGPFSAKQMRDWFNDGFFNEFTLVALNSDPDTFVQLGLLFPEGEGAFLTEGDQAGARARQAEIDAQARMGAGSIAFDGNYNPFDAPQQGQQDNFGYDPNAAMYGTLGAAGGAMAATNAWGGPEQAYVPPPEPVDYSQVANLDPYAATGTDDGGKGLFLKALSGSQNDPSSLPPPALGAAGGAPPPALQAQQSDNWGIVWDDEPDWKPTPTAEATPVEEAVPMTVAGNEDEEDEEDVPTITKFAELQSKYLSTVDALYVFLTRSLPKHLGTVRCKIKRSVVGLHMNYNLYELYLERDDGTLGPQILIAQKHRRLGFDSFYNIGIGSVNKKESGKVISSLIFNTLGTNFVCHNNVNAHKGKPRDLACIVYQRNIGKGPRKFQVALPALRDGSETEQVEWPHNGSVKRSKMLQALVSLDFPRLQPLVNKKPTWSKKHRAWVLNFHGRVTRSSVKNFQLVRPDDNKNVVLQFGRIGTDSFTMDVSWPCSPVAAFAICVSSLHSKLAVE